MVDEMSGRSLCVLRLRDDVRRRCLALTSGTARANVRRYFGSVGVSTGGWWNFAARHLAEAFLTTFTGPAAMT